MTVRLEVDISEPMRALRRIDSGPNSQTILRFESVLAGQFQATQEYVHIKTGSLKASGHISSELRDDVWSGVIEYGGPAPGYPNDPVDYAAYEQRRVGGRQVRDGKYSGQITSHDFMTPIYGTGTAYAETILAYLRGEL